ncbi:hypothetical protein C8R41DRAFT_868552 [Lentinula lateritia]|uniref:SAP domain-containing protein n=1 Tax=Lentinula lateritia TaxID=40482 RepID=A0ABQ8VBM6_9AGAR|nr:hypothetical protein C8R41DRAFT_868552 [Lentinula lateritia]
MDINTTTIHPAAESPPLSISDLETITLDGQEFRIRRPPGPQPDRTIALPVHNSGVFDVDYVDIYVMKRTSLAELCKKNNLGTVGKKAELQEKLIGFSENMIFPSLIVSTKMEAANTSTMKPKKLKGSALRRNVMMGLNPDGSSNVQVQRSKDMRPVEEQEKLLRWADRYYVAHPYVPPEEVSRMLKAERDAKMESFPTTSPMLTTLLIPTPSPTLTTLLIPTTSPMPTTSLMPMILPTPTTSLTPTDASSLPSALHNNDVIMADAVALSVLPSTARKAHRRVEEKLFEIILANQNVLRFKYHDIPEPLLQLSFAHDIIRLDHIWDDKQPNWDPVDCATVSVINGVPVALCYWQQVYKGKKDQRWDSIKGVWSEWRYVAERYWSSTSEEFWSEFQTDAGEPMNWTSILERLRELQINCDEELAERARAEYGSRFPVLFSYRGKVMLKSSSIANRYLSLQNVA